MRGYTTRVPKEKSLYLYAISATTMKDTLPLDGIRIVALEHVLTAPYCSMILADLGAEVIKIERPDIGDDSRNFGPFVDNQSGYFISINRNKKSIAVNLKTPEGLEIVKELIKKSDVVLENFRPGTLKKLGLDYESLRQIKPNIIYVSISGFGHDTVSGYEGLPGYDIIAQAYGGLMDITGQPDGPPTRVGSSVADIFAGLYAAVGILAAIHKREKTGEGCRIDIAMVDSIVSVLENAVVRYTLTGKIPRRIGSRHPSIAPFDVFEAKDGWLVIGVGNDSLWARFCKAIGKEELINNPKFKTNQDRVENYDELKNILTEWTKNLSVTRIVKILRRAGVPCAPVNTVKDIVEDPNINYRGMILKIEQPKIGEVKIAGDPLLFSFLKKRKYTPSPAPLLGEHTKEVLMDILKYNKEKIDELVEKKIIRIS